MALDADPLVSAAFSAMEAQNQAFPQAIAQMAPQVHAHSVTTHAHTNAPFPHHFRMRRQSLTVTQPIYHLEHWAQWVRARHIQKGAVATYVSATQALIIRVAERYFAILAALDDQQVIEAQKNAFTRQWEETQQRFEAGLVAITDVQEAKARRDQAQAEVIAAQNTVANAYEKLQEITGCPIHHVSSLSATHPLPLFPPSPNTMEAWVTTAEEHNPDIIAAREEAKQRKAAIATEVAGYFPRVDFSGHLERFKDAPPFFSPHYVHERTVSLKVTVPLFSGGETYSRTRQAQAYYCEALQKEEQQHRITESAVRTAFRNVLTAIHKVQALEQAVLSSKNALKATQAAYDAGTRTMVDILDAQSRFSDVQRQYAKARYQYLLEGLKLKQTAGIISPEDISQLNRLFLS